MHLCRKLFVTAAGVLAGLSASAALAQQLPSRNEGQSNQAIMKFVGWTVVDMRKDWNKVFAFQ